MSIVMGAMLARSGRARLVRNGRVRLPGMGDLDAMARRVIDGNLYMTLATLDPDGAPRLSRPGRLQPGPMTEIRLARADDAAAIAELRALWTGGETGADFAACVAAWLEEEGERRTTWLAERDGSAVGVASLFEYRRMPKPSRPASRWGYVSNMFVREEARGAGVGAALLNAVIAAAESRGYARLVLSPSERAVPFYARAGFLVPDGAAGSDRLLVRPARPTGSAPGRR
jgi:GNAT superfamily N-acetyltransferase